MNCDLIEQIISKARLHQIEFNLTTTPPTLSAPQRPPTSLIDIITEHRDDIIEWLTSERYTVFNVTLSTGEKLIAVKPEAVTLEWMNNHLTKQFGAERIQRVIPTTTKET